MNIQDSFISNIRKRITNGIQWESGAFLLLSYTKTYKGVNYEYTVEDNFYLYTCIYWHYFEININILHTQ